MRANFSLSLWDARISEIKTLLAGTILAEGIIQLHLYNRVEKKANDEENEKN